MTTNNNSESVMVEVTEGDRKLYVALFGPFPELDRLAVIEGGEQDCSPQMQTLARHRIEAEASKGAEIEALRAERDGLQRTIKELRDKPYAPWPEPEDGDTVGAMIDNQAWVMASHIASIVGHRDGQPDLMEQWQDDWLDNHEELLKHWLSPHRAMAGYIAQRVTITQKGGEG